MPFDQSQILSVSTKRRVSDLQITWLSSAAVGTWFQVYANRQLVDSTKSRRSVIPAPSVDTRIDIGTVATGEARTDFSASLPAKPNTKALLEWTGGTFLDPLGLRDVAGFFVYASATPAGFGSGGFGMGGFGQGLPSVDYSEPLANIPAYTNGITTDGFGMGGFGMGGFGASSGSYSWESDPLVSGLWSFAVAAYDSGGNVGVIAADNLAIAAAPSPPAASQGGSRLTYTLAGFGVGGFGGQGFGMGGFGQSGFGGGVGFGQSQVILNWNPAE